MMEIAHFETQLDDEVSWMQSGSYHELDRKLLDELFEESPPRAEDHGPKSPSPNSPISNSSEILLGSPQASNDKDSLLAAYKLLSEEDKSDGEIEVKQQLFDVGGVDSATLYRQTFLEEDESNGAGNDPFNFEETRGKYRVVEKVGEGTFSSVYKAISLDSRQEVVALKRIYPTCSPDRILNEMKFLKLLGGKGHVAPLLGALRMRDQVTLVLPYVEHHKFKDYLPLMTHGHIRYYMKALFESLRHLHAHKIIHRDVKPGNFLYNPQTNQFVLVDFGLAQMAEVRAEILYTPVKRRGVALAVNASPTSLKRRRSDAMDQLLQSPAKRSRFSGSNGVFIRATSPVQPVVVKRSMRAPRGGTRGFRAPEVLLKCQNQTVAIDIWSAGVMLLSILSTRYPFFSAPDDLVSLLEIAALFGTQEVRDVARKLNRNVRFPYDPHEIPKTSLKTLCNWLSNRTEPMPDSVFDLLERCLDLNPFTRITAEQALEHPFFMN